MSEEHKNVFLFGIVSPLTLCTMWSNSTWNFPHTLFVLRKALLQNFVKMKIKKFKIIQVLFLPYIMKSFHYSDSIIISMITVVL